MTVFVGFLVSVANNVGVIVDVIVGKPVRVGVTVIFPGWSVASFVGFLVGAVVGV